MARSPYLSSDFLSSVRARLFWSDTEDLNAYTNAQLLEFADSVIRGLHTDMQDIGECYLTTQYDAAVDGDDQGLIVLPGSGHLGIEGVYWRRDQQERTGTPLQVSNERDSRALVPYAGYPSTYWARGGRVWSNPYPTSGYWRVLYAMSPLAMSTSAEYRVVASVSDGDITTTEALPNEWDDTMDYVVLTQATPHSAVQAIESSSVSSHAGSVLGTSLGLVQARPGDILVADYETPVPQIPMEAREYLVVRTAQKVWQSLGDQAEAGGLESTVRQEYATLTKAYRPRDQGSTHVFVNEDSELSGAYAGYWRGRDF